MPFPVFSDRQPNRRPTIAVPDPYVFADHLGEPIPIFLHKDLAARDALAQLVTAGGGELVQTMRQSVFLIVDPMSSDGQDTIDGYGERPDKRVLRPEWLHICVAAGRIAIANDWAGCRLGRGPPPRKRPAGDDPFDSTNPNKHPRTDPTPNLPPAPISYPYNPAYPIVPGYYPAPAATSAGPTYAYYDPTSSGPTAAQQQPIKKRTPRPPRQPNRPWSLEENIALYTFMAQHPAPTEREQATLVRRWAKETRPDRGRQSWVAHAFATSFKNWVKEYEAGNINANPADFGTGGDAEGEADADHDQDEPPGTDPPPTDTANPQSDFTQPIAGGTEFAQFHNAPSPYAQSAGAQFSGASQNTAGSFPQYTSDAGASAAGPSSTQYTSPTPSQTTQYTTTPPNPPPNQGSFPHNPGSSFAHFSAPHETTTEEQNTAEGTPNGGEGIGESAKAGATNGAEAGTTGANTGTEIPPIYPQVYPPSEVEQAKDGT